MNTRTAYAQAIQLLTADDIDYRSIVIRLAQTNPALFVKLSGGSVDSDSKVDEQAATLLWVKQLHDSLKSDDAALAIDAIRRRYDLCLADAKNVAIHYAKWIRDNRDIDTPVARHSMMTGSPEADRVFNQLIKL